MQYNYNNSVNPLYDPCAGVLEEAEFYNVAGAISAVGERIRAREEARRHLPSGKKHMYRVLQCHENELTQLISTMSDGWDFEQVSAGWDFEQVSDGWDFEQVSNGWD